MCLVVSLALLLLAQGLGMVWTSAIAATLTFWLVAPLTIYSIAGGVASWQVRRILAV